MQISQRLVLSVRTVESHVLRLERSSVPTSPRHPETYACSATPAGSMPEAQNAQLNETERPPRGYQLGDRRPDHQT